jgi:hypothetical protein
VSKYGNRRTVVDGCAFASKAEARRYQQLKMLERGGAIEALKLQPRFPINVCGVKICTYVGDFQYTDRVTGESVVEDVKGALTPVYKIKKLLMRAVHGVEIQEVRS